MIKVTIHIQDYLLLFLKKLGLKAVREYELPKREVIYWDSEPEHTPRWYQSKSVELLAPPDGSRTQGAIEVGTGLGKTFIMALLIKEIGLSTVIMVPTLSIAVQALKDFKKWFGPTKVGQFFGGKKQSDRFIVVAVSKSLSNVKKGDEHYKNLTTKKIVLTDEAHLAPPQSLSSVLFGLFSNIPYRYFVSGTVLRNDGLGLLLDAITGDIVFKMSVEQGINEGFLSPLKFFQVKVKSDSSLDTDDVIKMNRAHLQQNRNVYRHAAELINKAVIEKKRRVLVLVDTVDQYQRLLDGGLTVTSMFGHGPLTKDNRELVPVAQRNFHPMDLVADFDLGKFPVLVATGALSCGTDIRSADLLVNIVGLTSEIETRQGVGRGTRLFPGKIDTIYIDYDVYNCDIMHRHAKKRLKIYNEIYGSCKVLEWKGN
jgi:superfamily II DNA or RNA helicase